MTKNIVAIQGLAGSFHQMAAHQLCGTDINLIHCPTFEQVFDQLLVGSANYAVAAVENTLHGKIAESNLLIKEHASQLCYIGDLWLPISMCLIGLPESGLKDITDIYSQDVALSQCQIFIKSQLKQTTQHDFNDTAAAVAAIAAWQDSSRCAIAGKQAAIHYGLKVLAADIQDTSSNQTRFLLFRRA